MKLDKYSYSTESKENHNKKTKTLLAALLASVLVQQPAHAKNTSKDLINALKNKDYTPNVKVY